MSAVLHSDPLAEAADAALRAIAAGDAGEKARQVDRCRRILGAMLAPVAAGRVLN